jgi:hypothetical protein
VNRTNIRIFCCLLFAQGKKYCTKQLFKYIHNNPVSGKWNLAEDYTLYEHSSASFYEDGTIQHFKTKNFGDL